MAETAIPVRVRTAYASEMMRLYRLAFAGSLLGLLIACGSDDSANEAVRHGVGATCVSDDDCTEAGQSCLPFKGGYCGVADCALDVDCPAGSACVTHDDGKNYCFLVCVEKPECNYSRPAELEANCSSNITFVSGDKTRKACVPPTG